MADERINGLGALESILPDKTQDRGWFSKGVEALAETAINLGTLGVVDPEFSGEDLIGPIYGEQQPQGVRLGPGALLGPAGMLAPSVEFDLKNRDVNLRGALPYLARQITRDDGGLAAPPGSGLSTSIVSSPPPDLYANLSSAQAGHALSLRDSDSYSDQQKYESIINAPAQQQPVLAQQSLEQTESASGSPTVICTELHRQGLIPEEWYKVDQKIGQQFWHSDPEVMIGYLSWGVPVAKLMAKSKVVTFLAKGLALKWAEEMYAQECKPELSTSAGRALCKYGPRICKFIGRRISWQDQKVG